MTAQKQELTLGQNISNRFECAAVPMGTYYWMVHTRTFPEDFAATALAAKDYLPTTEKLAKTDAEAWSKASRSQIGKLLTYQLREVMKETVAIVDAPSKLEDCLATHQTGVVHVGLDIVQTLAMQHVEQEGYVAKNPALARINNPFNDSDVFNYFYELQETDSIHKVRLLPLRVLVPGIETSDW